MTARGLGIELRPDGVLATTATGTEDDHAPTHFPPVLRVEGTRLLVGVEAVGAGGAHARDLVDDLVGQFRCDRLWLAGGRMITPDDALEGLLRGIAAQLGDESGAPADAVTISCPLEWDAATRARVVTIAGSAALPAPEVTSGLDVRTAAADARLRCPPVRHHTVGPPLDLPPRESALGPRRRPATTPAPVPTTDAHLRARRSRPGPLVVGGAVALAVGALMLALRAGGEPVEPTTSTAPSTWAPGGDPGPAVVPTSIAPLTIGVLSNGATGAQARVAAAELDAAGGALGHDVTVLAQPMGETSEAAVTALVERGANALITDITDDHLGAVVAAADRAGLAVCATARPATDVAGVTAVFADVARCVTFVALATIEAGDADAGRVRRAVGDLLAAPGVECDSFAQCRVHLNAGQPISYRPAGGPVRAATDP